MDRLRLMWHRKEAYFDKKETRLKIDKNASKLLSDYRNTYNKTVHRKNEWRRDTILTEMEIEDTRLTEAELKSLIELV